MILSISNLLLESWLESTQPGSSKESCFPLGKHKWRSPLVFQILEIKKSSPRTHKTNLSHKDMVIDIIVEKKFYAKPCNATAVIWRYKFNCPKLRHYSQVSVIEVDRICLPFFHDNHVTGIQISDWTFFFFFGYVKIELLLAVVDICKQWHAYIV